MRIAFTFLFLLSVVSCLAQTDTTATQANPDTLRELPATTRVADAPAPLASNQAVFRKNIVKLNLSSLAFYNNSLSYERSLARKTTLVVGYRYMPKTTATSAYAVKKFAAQLGEEDEELNEDLQATLVGNHTFTGELRFYGGKKPGARGFYFSLYGRYLRLEASLPHTFETETRIYSLPLATQISGFGAGVMIGSQWLIAKRVAFDWYILGGHFGKLQVKARSAADLRSLSADEKRGLERDLESLGQDLPLKPKTKATVSAQGANLNGSAPFIGLRSLGFNLGIAF